MLLSVVVSTWRRPKELKLVLAGLVAQSLAFKDFEVIVVDSNSGDETPDVVREFEAVQGFNVRLEQAELNSASAKRNKGVRLAKGRYVVLLDDDCVPDPAHLSNFLNAANSRRGERVIWCGGVRFSCSLVSTSNYYRYRDSCHFSADKPLPNSLGYKTIVTMNMLAERDILLQDNALFDERFVGYGFEDTEFGLRVGKLGYSVLPCRAEIEHVEPEGSISKFCRKYYHAARDGMPEFMKVATTDDLETLGPIRWMEPGFVLSSKFQSLFRAVCVLRWSQGFQIFLFIL